MTSRVVLPKAISEEIRYDGREAIKKRLEAAGALFGLYSQKSASFSFRKIFFYPKGWGWLTFGELS